MPLTLYPCSSNRPAIQLATWPLTPAIDKNERIWRYGGHVAMLVSKFVTVWDAYPGSRTFSIIWASAQWNVSACEYDK